MKSLYDVLCERDAFQTHGQRSFYLTALRKRGIDVDAFTIDDVFENSSRIEKVCHDLEDASDLDDDRIWEAKATQALELHPFSCDVLRAIAETSYDLETSIACGMAIRQLCRHFQKRSDMKTWSERSVVLSLVSGLDEIMEGFAHLDEIERSFEWFTDESTSGKVTMHVALSRLLLCTSACSAPWAPRNYDWAKMVATPFLDKLNLHVSFVLSEFARTFFGTEDAALRQSLALRFRELVNPDNEDERDHIVTFFSKRIDGFAIALGLEEISSTGSRFLDALTSFNPYRWEGARSFYLDTLASMDVSVDAQDLRDQPTEWELERIERIVETTTDEEYVDALTSAIDDAPTSIALLSHLAETTGTVSTSIACGLAVEQIAVRIADQSQREHDRSAALRIAVTSGSLYVLSGLISIGEMHRIPDLLADIGKRSPMMITTAYRYVVREITLSTHPEAEEFFHSLATFIPMMLVADPGFASDLALSRLAKAMISESPDVAYVQKLRAECLAIAGIRDTETMRFYCDRVAGFEEFIFPQHKILSPSKHQSPMKDFHRLLDRQQINSIEDLKAFMTSMAGKPIPEIPLEELTDDELAEDLADEAMNYPAHQQREMLLRLAADHPTSMAPWLRLADIAVTGTEMLDVVEQGLAAGSRFADPAYVAENTGHYWGITDTRPYMLLLNKRSQALYRLGRLQDSIDVYELILRLNPDDNMGTRVVLTTLLLQRGLPEHLTRANEIFQQYDTDTLSVLQWNRLLYRIATKAPAELLAETFKNAMKANTHVPGILFGKRPASDNHSGAYILGGAVEAVDYADMAQRAWASYPSALRELRRLLLTITPGE